MIKLHTNHGVITLELFEEQAPQTAANFKEYVKKGHYNGTIFHRVISNFMIQGGGFEPGMKQKKRWRSDQERSQKRRFQQTWHYRHGPHQ